MRKVEKIARDAKVLTESARDVARDNIISAIRSKILKMDESQIPILLQLIEVSINDGYSKAVKSFQRSLEITLLSE